MANSITQGETNFSNYQSSYPGFSTTNYYAAANTGTQQKNAKTCGDPVRISTGEFVTSNTDLSFSYINSMVLISRFYQSNSTASHSFGPAWSFNYDTRIVLGVKPGAAEAVTTLEDMIVAMDFEGQRQQLNAAAAGYNTAKGLGHFVAEANAGLAQITELHARLDALEERMELALDLAREELEHAQANEARDRYVFNDTDPENQKYISNTHLTLIDEAGSTHLYVIDATPDHDSGLVYEDGSHNYYPDGARTTAVIPGDDELFIRPDGSYVLTKKDTTRYYYSFYGQIEKITDPNGNTLTFNYNGNHYLSAVVDGFNRSMVIERNIDGKIVKTTDPAGRVYEYSYAGEMLVQVTDAAGDSIGYLYEENRLTGITKPDGTARNYFYEENEAGSMVVTKTRDEEGNYEHFSYNIAENYSIYTTDAGVWEKHYFDDKYQTVKIEYIDGSYVTMVYDENSNMIERVNELGYTFIFEYDENKNMIKATDPEGESALFSYTDRNDIDTITDKEGNLTAYSYDEAGNLISITYPDQSVTLYEYNTAGQPVKVTDRNGNSLSYTYDGNGFAASSTDAEQQVTYYTNDVLGNLISFKDPAGNITSFEYNADNKVIKTADAVGNVETFTYNNRKDLISRTDKMGNVTTFEYDGMHNVVRAVNALGEESTYTYRMDGKMLSQVVGEQSTTYYEYDSRGNLLSITQAETGITVENSYDAAGQLVSQTDPNGNITEYTYNSLGKVTSITNAEGGVKEFEYNKNLMMTRVTDEAGNATFYSYDVLDRITQVVDSENIVRSFSYDKEGNLISSTDGMGKATTFEHDKNYNTIRITDPAGNSIQRTFDARGFISSETDKLGFTSLMEYDALGRVTRITGPTGDSQIMVYDANGNLTSLTDQEGNTTTFGFDPLNRTVSQTNALGDSSRVIYNYLGLKETKIDEEGNNTSYLYNEAGRLVKEVHPLGAYTTYGYDQTGNVTSVTDEEGFVTTYEYDSLGRLIKSTDPGGIATSYTYDAIGNNTSFSVGEGETYFYEYDKISRMVREINREGKEQTFTYDNNSNLISKTDFVGKIQINSYDVLNRLTKTEYADATIKTFTYDAAGNMLTAENKDALTSFSYDSLGHIQSESSYYKTSTLSKTIKYAYDKVGNQVTRTIFEEVPGKGKKAGTTAAYTTRYAYNEVYNLITLTDSEGGITTFTYDTMGRPVNKELPNNTGTDYTYDKTGKIKTLVNWEKKVKENKGSDKGKKKGHAELTSVTVEKEVLQSYGYIYDKRGKLTYRVEGNSNITAYSYDNAGRLKEVHYPFSDKKKEASEKELEDAGLTAAKVKEGMGLTISAPVQTELETLYAGIKEKDYPLDIAGKTYFAESFTYDANSNILAIATPLGTIEQQFDRENRLTRKGNRNYTHDANGNLTKETIAKHDVTYSYNPDNRLVNIYGKGDWKYKQDHVKGEKWGSFYSYDALGRQIEKAEYHLTKDETEAKLHDVTFTFYEGLNPVYSYKGKFKYDKYAPGVDKSHLDSLEYNYGQGKILSTIERDQKGTYRDEKSNFYYTDNLGSVTYVTTAKGGAHEELEYDAWGFIYKGKVDKTNFIGYNGKVFDAQSQTYNYGFRDYSPAKKQWLTVDPIRDSLNWKGYIGHVADPVNYVDTDGLELTLGAIVVVGGAIVIVAMACVTILNSPQARRSREDFVRVAKSAFKDAYDVTVDTAKSAYDFLLDKYADTLVGVEPGPASIIYMSSDKAGSNDMPISISKAKTKNDSDDIRFAIVTVESSISKEAGKIDVIVPMIYTNKNISVVGGKIYVLRVNSKGDAIYQDPEQEINILSQAVVVPPGKVLYTDSLHNQIKIQVGKDQIKKVVGNITVRTESGTYTIEGVGIDIKICPQN